jgi:2-C-methyl-D-erythritol 2,4-cyclodiphosphate synthase
MRVGFGVDVHRFSDEGTVRLCGIEVDDTRGIEATSDGDVALHALIDALLGAAGVGDIGMHFPSSDPRWAGSDSAELLAAALAEIVSVGYSPSQVDVTIIAESVRISPHREAMRARLASLLNLRVDDVSVKATSTDGLGFLGTGEGIAATAVATIAEH